MVNGHHSNIFIFMAGGSDLVIGSHPGIGLVVFTGHLISLVCDHFTGYLSGHSCPINAPIWLIAGHDSITLTSTVRGQHTPRKYAGYYSIHYVTGS